MKTKSAFAYAFEFIGLDEYTFAELISISHEIRVRPSDILAAVSGRLEPTPYMWDALRSVWHFAEQDAKKHLKTVQQSMKVAKEIPSTVYLSDLFMTTPQSRLLFMMIAMKLPRPVPVKFE